MKERGEEETRHSLVSLSEYMMEEFLDQVQKVKSYKELQKTGDF